MKRRVILWLLLPLAIAVYIAGMARLMADKRDEGPRGPHPNAYASPNGNAWGFGHGSGRPDKTP
jgi:hypothetical protein